MKRNIVRGGKGKKKKKKNALTAHLRVVQRGVPLQRRIGFSLCCNKATKQIIQISLGLRQWHLDSRFPSDL